MVRQITQGWTNSGIEIMICNIIFLHFKERWVIMASLRLQEIKPGHNKGQDTITLDRKSNQQIEGSKIL